MLPPRQPRVFDEVNDIVSCDLVLVMDSFDAVEVRSLLLPLTHSSTPDLYEGAPLPGPTALAHLLRIRA